MFEDISIRVRSAVAKIVENIFREVNIALANESALICEHVDEDIIEAIKIVNTYVVNMLNQNVYCCKVKY